MRCGLRGVDVLRVSGEGGATLRLLCDDFSLQILSGLRHVLRLAQIAPIIFIGAKSEDLFSLGSEPQIRGDDGERAFFAHHPKQTRRNNVDAGKSQSLPLLGRPNSFRLPIAAALPSAKPKAVVEQQVA